MVNKDVYIIIQCPHAVGLCDMKGIRHVDNLASTIPGGSLSDLWHALPNLE